jgi:hypothetical protein
MIGCLLFDMIDHSYVAGKERSYIYRFLNQHRDLPKDLKSLEWDVEKLRGQFAVLIADCLRVNLAPLIEDIRMQIAEDEMFAEDTKKRLFRLSEQVEAALFLAELFIFVVDHSTNQNTENREKRTHGSPALIRQMEKVSDNEILCHLAKVALNRKDMGALAFALEKMKNHIYLANVLVAMTQDDAYGPDSELDSIFHKHFSRFTHNNYRYDVFVRCLRDGFFSKHPNLLLASHLCEYQNQLYLHRTLCWLFTEGFPDEVKRYKDLLKHKTYAKRLHELIEPPTGL